MDNLHQPQPMAPCQACPNDEGQAVGVSFGRGVKTIRLRCSVCGREWLVVEPAPPDPRAEFSVR